MRLDFEDISEGSDTTTILSTCSVGSILGLCYFVPACFENEKLITKLVSFQTQYNSEILQLSVVLDNDMLREAQDHDMLTAALDHNTLSAALDQYMLSAALDHYMLSAALDHHMLTAALDHYMLTELYSITIC